MRITTTRPVAATVVATAALAVLAAGCGGGGGTGKPPAPAAPSSSAASSPGADDAPVGDTGDDTPMTSDDMAKARPMDPAAPSKAAPETGGDHMAPERDNGRPGAVGPVEPGPGGTASSAGRAAPTAVRKARLPVQRSPRIGRIFGKAGHGRYYFCSASVVPSRGKNLIVTAAHCLWNERTGKRQARNWQFVPGYYTRGGKGYAPYGVYSARRWWAYKAWINKRNWRYDFAFMKLRPAARGYHGAGRPVQASVGAMGIAWNQRPNRTYAAIGYDAQRRYRWDNGCCAYYRAGRGHWIRGWAQLNLTHRFSTGGASGGPWLIRYSARKRIGVVDGVNSRSDRRSTATSPYFGSALRKLYYAVR